MLTCVFCLNILLALLDSPGSVPMTTSVKPFKLFLEKGLSKQTLKRGPVQPDNDATDKIIGDDIPRETVSHQ